MRSLVVRRASVRAGVRVWGFWWGVRAICAIRAAACVSASALVGGSRSSVRDCAVFGA